MGQNALKTVLVVDSRTNTSKFTDLLAKHNFTTEISNNPRETLEASKKNTPDLVIVEKGIPEMKATTFLADLLKISWTTSTILIADEEEEALHEETEGLGILGSVKSADDLQGLERLLEVFFRLRPA